MMTEEWGTTSTFSKPALTKHNSKANIAARSLDASFFRPSFSRPSETTLQGDLRLKPIRVRAVQQLLLLSRLMNLLELFLYPKGF